MDALYFFAMVMIFRFGKNGFHAHQLNFILSLFSINTVQTNFLL